MTKATTKDPVETLAEEALRALAVMDSESPAGLCDYVSVSPFAGKLKKNEAALAWGVTQHLQKNYAVEQAERAYRGTQKRCDRVVELSDGATVWLEMKHAWRQWFYERVTPNNSSLYKGYFHGNHKTYSVAHDFKKLETLHSAAAAYGALLVVGFDGNDGQMTEDMNMLARTEGLAERGWKVRSSEWVTRQSEACWHRCWFWWRKIPS